MSLLAELHGLMASHGFSPNHRFGQNFVVDELLLQKIVEATGPEQGDIVLEVGAGVGFLTSQLLKHSKVIAVEKEEKMAGILRQRFSSCQNFLLIEADFRDANPPFFNKVACLPPYHLSTDLMLFLLRRKPERAVCVFQKEFAEKITSQPGFGDYNYVSALTSLYYGHSILLKSISPKSFHPKPASYSSLVLLERKNDATGIKDFQAFAAFMRNLFRYKNKNLRNAIGNAAKSPQGYIIAKKKLAEFVSESPLADERVNTLEPEAFPKIFKRISPK